jgi:hypothetical protein
MNSMQRRVSAIASIAGVLAVGAPATGALAATGSTPASATPFTWPAGVSLMGGYTWPAGGPITLTFTMPSSVTPVTLKFTPPSVGRIGVDIGPIIIDGKQISPGVHVATPPITVPAPAVNAGG